MIEIEIDAPFTRRSSSRGPVYPRLRGTMLTTTPKRHPASKSLHLLALPNTLTRTRQRARKRPWTALAGPPAGKSGARGRGTRGGRLGEGRRSEHRPRVLSRTSDAARPRTPVPPRLCRRRRRRTLYSAALGRLPHRVHELLRLARGRRPPQPGMAARDAGFGGGNFPGLEPVASDVAIVPAAT